MLYTIGASADLSFFFFFFPLPPHIFFPLLVSIKCQVNFLGGMSYTLPCALCVCVRFVCKHTHVYVLVCER